MATPVLVVDDDENIGKVFQMGLRCEGVDVVYFSNARDALIWVNRSTPSLAIVDVVMPEIDGVQFCQILRSRRETEALPIILISGIDGAELKKLASLVGAVNCVTKPFAPAEVFRLVHSYLGAND